MYINLHTHKHTPDNSLTKPYLNLGTTKDRNNNNYNNHSTSGSEREMPRPGVVTTTRKELCSKTPCECERETFFNYYIIVRRLLNDVAGAPLRAVIICCERRGGGPRLRPRLFGTRAERPMGCLASRPVAARPRIVQTWEV